MIYAIGRTIIEHADTGEIYTIDGVILKFKSIDTNTPLMGEEANKIYLSTVKHSQLGEITWFFRKHSDIGNNKSKTDAGFHKILQDVRFKFNLDSLTDKERQDRIDSLVRWFKENYKDPVDFAYHESREGGFMGSPADIRLELGGSFSDEPEDIIETAAKELESDGADGWYRYFNEDYDDPPIDGDLSDVINELNTVIDNAPKAKTDPAFAFGDDNRLHIIPPPDNQPVDSQDDLLTQLRTITNALLESLRGTNAHHDLLNIAEHYNEALSGEQISITCLCRCGMVLDNMARATNRAITANDLPSLSPLIEANLNSTIELHRIYIMSREDGQQFIQNAVNHRQTPEKIGISNYTGKQIAKNIRKKSALFGDDVCKYIPEVLENIGNGGQPELSKYIAENTSTNLVSSLLKAVKGTSPMTSGIIGGVVATSAPGAEAITIGADAINLAWYFLIDNALLFKTIAAPFAGEQSWLATVSDILERIRQVLKRDQFKK